MFRRYLHPDAGQPGGKPAGEQQEQPKPWVEKIAGQDVDLTKEYGLTKPTDAAVATKLLNDVSKGRGFEGNQRKLNEERDQLTQTGATRLLERIAAGDEEARAQFKTATGIELPKSEDAPDLGELDNQITALETALKSDKLKQGSDSDEAIAAVRDGLQTSLGALKAMRAATARIAGRKPAKPEAEAPGKGLTAAERLRATALKRQEDALLDLPVVQQAARRTAQSLDPDLDDQLALNAGWDTIMGGYEQKSKDKPDLDLMDYVMSVCEKLGLETQPVKDAGTALKASPARKGAGVAAAQTQEPARTGTRDERRAQLQRDAGTTGDPRGVWDGRRPAREVQKAYKEQTDGGKTDI